MIKAKISITLVAIVFSVSGYAMSPDAVEGKLLYAACETCHAQALDPPKAPPMWEVQRQYQRNYADDGEFIKKIVTFVKAPSLKTAIHYEAVKSFGLMPPMPLPDDMLQKIATYILEEEFPPPCDHWTIAMARAENEGSKEHARWYQRMHRRYCSNS